MHLVFCMAGLYQRFRKAGYTTPKYLLKVNKGFNILESIFYHFSPYQECFDTISLVVNQREIEFHLEIEKIVQKLFPSVKYKILFIGDTQGQAETAKIAIEYIKNSTKPCDPESLQDDDRKVMFHNIDTILLQRNIIEINNLLDTAEGVIDIFRADSPQYSYIKTDREGFVEKIAEKQVISDKATSGLYCFSDYEKYLHYYSMLDVASKSEIYISDVYKVMLEFGEKIVEYNSNNSRLVENTIILGTPEEYMAYTKQSVE